MKKIIVALLAFVLLCASMLGLVACGSQDKTEKLVVYNWADYIYDQEQLKVDFAEYYKEITGKNIEIVYVTFDTNETMLTKVTKGDANIDVMCPSEYAIQKLIEGNYLQKINYFTDASFENADKVDPDIISKIQKSFATASFDMTEYFVPYMWGTLGVLYNADYVTDAQAAEAGWGLLWNKNSAGVVNSDLTKKIYMKDSIRDSYCAVLMYMKEYNLLPEAYKALSIEQLINTVDETLIAKAEEVLISQKPELYGYEVDFGKNELIAGTALVDLAWSGDAFYAIEEAEAEGVTLKYYIPTVGSNIWFDGWVIPKTCSNVEAAKIFIDYLNDPVVAMENMMEIGYTTAVDKDVLLANEEAMAVFADVYAENPDDAAEVADLTDWYFNDENKYPDFDSDTLGVMHDFGESNEKVVAMWERVRATGVSAFGILAIVIGAAAVIAVIVLVIVKSKGGKRRKIVK